MFSNFFFIFQILEKYVQNTHATTHNLYTLDIVDIFKIDRKGEEKRFKPFKKLPNHKLLWHGSRTTNYAGNNHFYFSRDFFPIFFFQVFYLKDYGLLLRKHLSPDTCLARESTLLIWFPSLPIIAKPLEPITPAFYFCVM